MTMMMMMIMIDDDNDANDDNNDNDNEWRRRRWWKSNGAMEQAFISLVLVINRKGFATNVIAVQNFFHQQKSYCGFTYLEI